MGEGEEKKKKKKKKRTSTVQYCTEVYCLLQLLYVLSAVTSNFRG